MACFVSTLPFTKYHVCLHSNTLSWSVAPNWPAGGEIDTFEGINDVKNNRMTLHTEPVSNLLLGYSIRYKLQ